MDADFVLEGEVGQRTTVLSVDGGGVRGIIPSVQLQFLENMLQELDGPKARISDYFDVIAGTSTGGLIAAMLSTPNAQGHPLYTTNDIISLYMKRSKEVFPPKGETIVGAVEEVLALLNGPKYSPEGFEKVLFDILKDVKLSNTTTELFIPTFDIKLMQPVYFSTSQAKEDTLNDPFLRDVCRGTSAAPTFLPPYFFQTHDVTKKTSKDYNLVDGVFVENNPTYLSIIHMFKEKIKRSVQLSKRVKSNMDYKNFMVLSLGTGIMPESYLAKDAKNWGALNWLYNNGKVPIIDMLLEGSADIVDFNLSVLFSTLEYPNNYLRIQATNLSKDEIMVDNASDENLQRLYDIGQNLLDQQVSYVDIATGEYISDPSRGTNKDALTRFAQELVKENHARKTQKKHTKSCCSSQ